MKGIRLMLRRRGLLVAATVFASLGFASAASAATYTVNDTRDFPQSTTASSGSCVSTASTCTLRAAIMAANENGGSNTINLPAGTYPISNTSSTTTATPAYTPCTGGGDESIGDLKVNDCNNSTQVTVIGAGSGQTVINNSTGSSGYRLFTLYPNGSLDLQKMTLENGVGATDNYGTNWNSSAPTSGTDGGAIISEGHLSAESVTFTGNTASGEDGGAVAAENVPGSTASLTGSVFQNNNADDGGAVYTNAPNDVTLGFDLFQANNATYGGAVYGDKDASALTMNFDSLVQNVGSTEGGALYWHGNGSVNITNSLFNQNQSADGGGLYNDAKTSSNMNISTTSFDGNSSSGVGGGLDDEESNGLTLTQDKFSRNSAGTDGGAAYLFNGSGPTTITSSEFDGNQATGNGGAIYWYEYPLTLNGDSFVLNTAADGGALYDFDSTDPLKMVDTTMSRNTASSDGGAIDNDGNATPLTMVNDTIAFNNAASGDGGGVYDASDFVNDNTKVFGVENTTIAENSGGDCAASNTFSNSSSAAPLDQGNNNDSDQTCFGGLGGPNDKTGVNPLLANPANNGGPAAGGPGDTVTVQTDAEQANSPLIDAGNNNGCPSVDERGVTRPQGKACDIGAFEFGANPTTTTSTSTSVPGTTTTTSTPKPKPKPKPHKPHPKPHVSGHPQLVHNLLQVSGGKVSVTLKCASSKACKGRLNLIKHAFARVKGKRKLVTLRCTFRHFSIGAGKTATLTSKVSGGCLRLLKHAKHHRIIVRLNVIMTSGQKGIKGKNVILHLM